MKTTKLIINRDLYWAHRYALFAIAKTYREMCNDNTDFHDFSFTIFIEDSMIKSALTLLKLDTDNLENITEMHKLLSSKKTMEALIHEFNERNSEVFCRSIGNGKKCIVLDGIDIGTIDFNTKSIVLNYPVDKDKILSNLLEKDKFKVRYEFKED